MFNIFILSAFLYLSSLLVAAVGRAKRNRKFLTTSFDEMIGRKQGENLVHEKAQEGKSLCVRFGTALDSSSSRKTVFALVAVLI